MLQRPRRRYEGTAMGSVVLDLQPGLGIGPFSLDSESEGFTESEQSDFRGFTAPKVLTLEYVPGIKLNRVDKLDARGYDSSRIASRSIEAYLIQILKTGFFHADPHPGNLAIDEDEAIIYYDCGMMGEIKTFTRTRLLDLFYAVYEKDAKKVQKSCINAEVIDDPADIVLQPGDVLEQLMLPSPKDLEFLLHDSAKLAAPSKISDPRSAKTTPHRLSLPPLPFSHGYNGHCKSNYDASKLSCRSVCQGRLVRIANTSSFFGGETNCSVELDSLAYDSSLVPAGQVKYSFPLIGITSSFPNIPGYDQASSSGVCKTASSSCPEPISSMDCKVNDPQSPRLLIAAQTLFDIARQSSCQDPNVMTKWLNNSSPKAMKARKMSPTNESVERSVSRSETTYKDLSRLIGPSNPFKKPKLPMIEKKGDFSQMNPSRMRNYHWPPPTSSRSSPIRFSPRDNVAGERYSNGTTARQLIMIPPPPRVPDKSNNGQQKPRKVVPMDWARTRS